MTAAGAVLAVFTIAAIGCLGVSAVRPALRSWRTRRWLAEMDSRAAAAEADDGDDRGTADDDDDADPPPAAARDPHNDDYYLHYRRPPVEYPAELLRPRAPEPVPGTPEVRLASWSQAMRLIHLLFRQTLRPVRRLKIGTGGGRWRASTCKRTPPG